MKPLQVISIVLFTSAIIHAAEPVNEWQGKKVPQLILAKGKTFTDVTFSKIEPDAVTISHSGGILRIPMEDLKPEAQTALGYDPVKAAESRKQFEAQKQALDQANEARLAANQAMLAEQIASAEAEAAREAKLASAKREGFIVLSVTPDGLLVNTFTPGGYSRVAAAVSSITGGGGDGYIPPRRGEKVFLMKGIKDVALVDEDRFEALYTESTETYKYETAFGSAATVAVLEAVQVKKAE
jgi:hypothetical protein